MEDVSVVGIDLAKASFSLVGMNVRGKVLIRKRVNTAGLKGYVRSLRPGVTIAMESCASSNYWSREFSAYGHEVKLIAPQFVKPYVKSNKNDDADAEAIAEAASRPTMRFVPTKSVEQQDLQSLHRVRERLVKSRTALINEARGLLGEYGVTLPRSVSKFRKMFLETLERDASKMTPLSREMFFALFEEYMDIEKRIAYYESKLKSISHVHPVCKRLQTIPGVGVLTATAIIAAVSDAAYFKNGREFSAWLGLVPRQNSTGGRAKLSGISKRGDVYLRKLLIHGARCTLRWSSTKKDRLNVWAHQLKERKGSNRAAVALANKNGRIIWSVLAREEGYKTFACVA